MDYYLAITKNPLIPNTTQPDLLNFKQMIALIGNTETRSMPQVRKQMYDYWAGEGGTIPNGYRVSLEIIENDLGTSYS